MAVNQRMSLRNLSAVPLHIYFELSFFLDTDRHECTSYMSLGSKDRNIKYMGAGLMCDHGISTGWYRFVGDAGTQMSTSCIQNRRHRKCSTHGVSWLNGAHPTFDEGKVVRTVCFSWVGGCCNRQRDIEVMNCGLFYVYKLVPTGPCSYRYCGIDVWIPMPIKFIRYCYF